VPDLRGRAALVTGAGRRIGRSVVLALAREGADVVVNYRTSRAEAEQVATEARALGVRAITHQADVCQRAAVQEMMGAIERQMGRLDILVNNAGAFAHVRFEDLTDEQWDTLLDTNLKSQFLCCQAALPLLRASGRGRIVNISSLGGLLAWPGYTHYCVSKAGSIMLTRCLARAVAPDILVNSVAPGTIQFPGEALDEDYIRRAPLKRTGTGEDIAEAVLFLVKSDFVTGQVLPVDGGRALV
jgi:3-oxoacyl-[acyl-carrier protein] reductase/pteridine reductase